jgi:hypothetical protein
MKLVTHLQLEPRSGTFGSIHPLPHMSWGSAQLVEHRDKFSFDFLVVGKMKALDRKSRMVLGICVSILRSSVLKSLEL